MSSAKGSNPVAMKHKIVAGVDLSPPALVAVGQAMSVARRSGAALVMMMVGPIPDAAEAWLMSRLPKRLDSTAGRMLTRAFADYAWDGAPTAALRDADGTFFESRVAYGVRWGDGSLR